MKIILFCFGGILAKLSMGFATIIVNSTCPFTAYQPKLSDNLKTLRKF